LDFKVDTKYKILPHPKSHNLKPTQNYQYWCVQNSIINFNFN